MAKTPTALSVLRGNPSRRPLNTNEPQPDMLSADMPSELNSSPLAQKEWTRVAQSLIDLSILSEMDRTALIAYCLSYQQWQDALGHVREDGCVCMTKQGLVKNPYLTVADDAFSNMLKLMKEFGMTPSSRSSIKTISKNEDDKFAKFMATGKDR